MKNTKFIVKVDRGGAHAPNTCRGIDMTPIQTTPNRKLALVPYRRDCTVASCRPPMSLWKMIDHSRPVRCQTLYASVPTER